MKSCKRVIVLGAGVTGITSVWFLRPAGRSKIDNLYLNTGHGTPG